MTQYIYFYGYSSKNPYNYFSNFYPLNFKDTNGTIYCCSEQYFMKKKQERFDVSNEELANKIMNSKNPKEIKKLGRQVKNFDEEIWNKERYDIMKDALKLKFSQEELKNKLVSTGNAILVEASPTDRIWGIGMNESQVNSTHTNWKGLNLLGRALMEIREELAN